MALQNRVSPLSELVADSARGLVYGNRGCLHDETVQRRYDGKRWIACRLEFRGWRRKTASSARPFHRALLPRRGLVVGSMLLHWTAAGYADAVPRPTGEDAVVITPPSLVAVLRAGWEPVVPLLHPSVLATS
jgi:hypothetical protein